MADLTPLDQLIIRLNEIADYSSRHSGMNGSSPGAGIPAAGRNNALASVKGSLVRAGWPENAANDAVIALNGSLPAPLPQDELDSTVLARKDWAPGIEPWQQQWAQQVSQPPPDPGGFLDIMDVKVDTRGWVDSRLQMRRGAVSAWHGLPGIAKTVFLLGESLRMAADGASVLYAWLEGPETIGERVAAWCHANGRRRETFAGKMIFWPRPMHLSQGVELLGGKAAETGASLIVIDNLMSAAVGGELSGDKDMGMAVAACEEIARRTGAHVAVVHHDNRAGSYYGNTQLDRAVSARAHFEWASEPDGLIRVTIEKSRSRKKDSWLIGIREVQIPNCYTDDGEPVISIITEHRGDIAALASESGARDEAAFRVLRENPGRSMSSMLPAVGRALGVNRNMAWAWYRANWPEKEAAPAPGGQS